MDSRPRARLLVVLAALLPACARPEHRRADAPAAAEAQLAPASVGSAPAHVFGDVYTAGQPSAGDLAAFAELGGETVLNLRKPEEPAGFDEAARARELGLDYVLLPWNGKDELTDDVFTRGRELLRTAERPLLLHCGSANRVGALWIPWRVLDGGLGLEEAVAEAKAIGLKTPEYEARARDYVARQRHR